MTEPRLVKGKHGIWRPDRITDQEIRAQVRARLAEQAERHASQREEARRLRAEELSRKQAEEVERRSRHVVDLTLAAADYADVSIEAITAPRGHQAAVKARWAVFGVLDREGWTWQEIAAYTDRDRTTVMRALRLGREDAWVCAAIEALS